MTYSTRQNRFQQIPVTSTLLSPASLGKARPRRKNIASFRKISSDGVVCPSPRQRSDTATDGDASSSARTEKEWEGAQSFSVPKSLRRFHAFVCARVEKSRRTSPTHTSHGGCPIAPVPLCMAQAFPSLLSPLLWFPSATRPLRPLPCLRLPKVFSLPRPLLFCLSETPSFSLLGSMGVRHQNFSRCVPPSWRHSRNWGGRSRRSRNRFAATATCFVDHTQQGQAPEKVHDGELRPL